MPPKPPPRAHRRCCSATYNADHDDCTHGGVRNFQDSHVAQLDIMRPTAVFIAPSTPTTTPRPPTPDSIPSLPPWVPRSTGFAPAGATNGTSLTPPWPLYAAQSVGSLGQSTLSAQLGCVRVASPGIQTSKYSKRYSSSSPRSSLLV